MVLASLHAAAAAVPAGNLVGQHAAEFIGTAGLLKPTIANSTISCCMTW